MALKRDENRVTVAAGINATDEVTELPFLVDPTTSRLLVDVTVYEGETITVASFPWQENNNTYWVDANGARWGQTFTAVAAKIINAKFYLRKLNSITGNLQAIIYAHTGTYGTNGTPTGSALATSDVVDVATLTGAMSLINFTFSDENQINLTAGTYYCLELYYSGASVSPNIVQIGTATNHQPSGNIFYYSGSYKTDKPGTVVFEIYGEDLQPSASSLDKCKIDENFKPTIYGVSTVDGITPVPIRTDTDGNLLASF